MANVKISELPVATASSALAGVLPINVGSTTHSILGSELLAPIGKVDAVTGYTLTGGTTPKTLTVSEDADSKDIPTAAEKAALTADYANLNKIVPTQVALAQAERDINELERTIQQGQGATIDIDDYGIVSLDARATGRANPTIEGRTATNLQGSNGSMASVGDWIGFRGILSVSDGILSVTGDASGTTEHARLTMDSVIDISAIYWNLGYIRVTNALCTKLRIEIVGSTGGTAKQLWEQVTPTANQWYSIKGYGTPNVNCTGNVQIYIIADYSSAPDQAGAVMQIKETATFNTTAIYGAGNEPSASDCAEIFSYFNGTKSISMPARVRSVGRNLFENRGFVPFTGDTLHYGTSLYTNKHLYNHNNNSFSTQNIENVDLYRIKPLTTYTISIGSVYGRVYGRVLSRDKKILGSIDRVDLTGSFTAPENAYYIILWRVIYSADGGTIAQAQGTVVEDIMLNLGSSALPYEPYQDSTLYIADDKEGRSIQDITDTVSVVNGEYLYTQKVSTPVAVLSGVAVNTTNYPLAKNGGKFTVELTAGGTQIGVIGTDSTTGDGTLRYELATSIATNLTTSGALKAFSKGSVYWEPYYEGSHQTNADGEITLPYGGTVEAVYGYDAQMVEYLLDPSEYALVGTTLTITDAVEDEVFYVELSRSEPLAPEMNVNVLNNLVVPTTVNAATYTVLDGDHTLLVAYSATGACAITIPSALIAKYIRLCIKDSGGSANTNNITIGTEGTEKIDGADTYVINAAKGSVELASDGANLFVVG